MPDTQTTSQPDKMASTLPTELIQTILLATNPAQQDTATYYSARLTCHRWYKAASTLFIVREVISQTPVIAPTPLPPLHSLAERDWNILFNQVARLNLLHHRTGSETISGTGSGYGRAVQYSTRELPPGCTSSSTPTATSGDGKKLAILKGSQVTAYSNNDKEGNTYEFTFTYTFTLTQSLYPSWTSICHVLHQGGLGSNHGYARHHLAISSHGNLVAVGLGKKIQVYDYSAPKHTTNTPAEYVLGQTETVFIPPSSAPSSPNYQDTDGVVESLEFADDDTLLRVGIGKESNPNRSSRVRYLGDPSSSSSKGQCLEYWRENLNRVYLDSVALATLLPDNDHKTASKGLRLFPENAAAAAAATTTSSRSFIAALQTQETRGYCIAEINHDNHHHQQPDANATVTIKRHLPSRANHHHSSNTTTTTIQEETNTKPQTLSLASQSRWNPIHLPTTTTQNPLLAISPDEKLLLVYEPGAGHSYYCMRGGAVYVYCLETFAPVSFSSSSSSTGGETSSQAKDATVMVQPWSYLLDVMDVDVEKLEVTKIRSRARGGIRAGDDLYTVTALGGGQVVKWCLG